MSQAFKVQKLSSINSNALSKTGSNKSKNSQGNNNDFFLGQISLSIPSISTLNYNSHALIQVLSVYFENQNDNPPYLLVQKSLAILSYSMSDQILKSDLQKLILKNLHRKRDVYVFFCLWSQYQSIDQIILKFEDKKTQQKILYLILLTYMIDSSKNVIWYENLALKQQIFSLVQMQIFCKKFKIIEQLDSQISNFEIQKYQQFQIMMTKVVQFVGKITNSQALNRIKKIPTNFMKTKNNSKFIDQLVQKFFINEVSKNHRQKLQFESILLLLDQYELKQVKQVLQNSISKQLQVKFNSEKKETLYQFISETFKDQIVKNKTKLILKISMKKWLVSADFGYLWKFFDENFKIFDFISKTVQSQESGKKRVVCLHLLNELYKQNQNIEKSVQKIFYSKYLFHYFEGRAFNYGLQLGFLEHEQSTKLQTQRQVISKGLKHIKNYNFLNIMILNKSSFPSCIDWAFDLVINQNIKKYQSISPLKKLLNRVLQYWQKLSQQLLIQNKRIELTYSVIRIQIDKRPYCVTFMQLADILKQYSEGKAIDIQSITNYRIMYSPLSTKQSIQQSKSTLMTKGENQIHPIIIQAKIIRLMKKQKKRASIKQISMLLYFNQQRIHQTVKKLVTKGYLQEHQDQTYSYQP